MEPSAVWLAWWRLMNYRKSRLMLAIWMSHLSPLQPMRSRLDRHSKYISLSSLHPQSLSIVPSDISSLFSLCYWQPCTLLIAACLQAVELFHFLPLFLFVSFSLNNLSFLPFCSRVSSSSIGKKTIFWLQHGSMLSSTELFCFFES